MVGTQVQFTEEQLATLRQTAAKRGASVSQVVRQGVERIIEDDRGPSQEELWRRARQTMGAFASDTGDLPERHDEYFAEACGQ